MGGLSWESSLIYYQRLNEGVAQRLGNLHSAKMLLFSADFGEIAPLMKTGDWEGVCERVLEGALSLQRGGADFLAIASNTVHFLLERIESRLDVPVLSVMDATLEHLKRNSLSRPLLLGTRFTMEKPFFRKRLEKEGLVVSTPDEPDREDLHRIIFEELCRGTVASKSARFLADLAARFEASGCDSVILGCTELQMLLSPDQPLGLPVVDTTEIHVGAILRRIL